MKTLPAMTLVTIAVTMGMVPAVTFASTQSGDSQLDGVETSHLTFMREEEKLARDVYLTLAEIYPQQAAFDTIATTSEQTHTDTMRDKLAQFDLPDPNPGANELPGSIGVYTGSEWGWYFEEKFAAPVPRKDSQAKTIYLD